MKAVTIGAAAGLAALAAGGAALAAAGADNSAAADGGAGAAVRTTAVRKIVLTAKIDPDSVHTEDVGPKGPSPGDLTVYSADLLRGGRPAGRMEGYTVAADPRYEGDVKTQYLLLRRGTIAIVGGGANKRPPGVGKRQDDSVVGGTGAYLGARGSYAARDIDDSTLRITLRLVR